MGEAASRAASSSASTSRPMLKRGGYLLDELTTGLDNAVARSLQKTLDKLAENARDRARRPSATALLLAEVRGRRRGLWPRRRRHAGDGAGLAVRRQPARAWTTLDTARASRSYTHLPVKIQFDHHTPDTPNP